MNDTKNVKFIEKITNLMIVSTVIWFLIIIFQFIVGLITLFGYGLATLIVMGYNIFSVINYIKTINYFKNNANYIPIGDFIHYFENQIPVDWVFLFVNLILGGFLGFVGSLYDLILSYYVKGKKGELLMPDFEPQKIDDYFE